MKIEIAWWDISDSQPDIEAANKWLTDKEIRQWENVPNLGAKYWLMDSQAKRWGALMIWQGEKPAKEEMPANIGLTLFGRHPDFRCLFSVPAAYIAQSQPSAVDVPSTEEW